MQKYAPELYWFRLFAFNTSSDPITHIHMILDPLVHPNLYFYNTQNTFFHIIYAFQYFTLSLFVYSLSSFLMCWTKWIWKKVKLKPLKGIFEYYEKYKFRVVFVCGAIKKKYRMWIDQTIKVQRWIYALCQKTIICWFS